MVALDGKPVPSFSRHAATDIFLSFCCVRLDPRCSLDSARFGVLSIAEPQLAV